MPELPDIVAYVEAIERVAVGSRLLKAQIYRPFLVRSLAQPSLAEGRVLESADRIGKRILLSFEGDLHFVIHLMIAGRLLWQPVAPARAGKIEQAAFLFESGCLVMTEAGTKRRAGLWVVEGKAGLEEHRRGGIEPLSCSLKEFEGALKRENRTLKRILTHPEVFSGIGNAYSDEILFAARLSPVRLSGSLTDEEIARLHESTKTVLTEWVDNLRKEFAGKFPGRGKVTAFRDEFNVHGRYGQPCRVCGKPIQRIVHAENETNYCARCQNEDRVLADRALSRLLKDDWPRSI